jgi:hypothetical protein
MKIIEFNGLPNRTLLFYGECFWGGKDHLITSNSTDKTLDYLVFFDSRGYSFNCEFSASVVGRMFKYLSSKNKSFLIVNRPLEITTWATLYNFLSLNNLSFGKLITNMGFVDFTPKKKSICEDSISQIEYKIGSGVAIAEYLEDYKSAEQELIPLYCLRYNDFYRSFIQEITSNHDTVIVNTPEISPHINYERNRPSSFFNGIVAGNHFNTSIQTASVINLKNFSKDETYDAVHYTGEGSRVVFEELKNEI